MKSLYGEVVIAFCVACFVFLVGLGSVLYMNSKNKTSNNSVNKPISDPHLTVHYRNPLVINSSDKNEFEEVMRFEVDGRLYVGGKLVPCDPESVKKAANTIIKFCGGK